VRLPLLALAACGRLHFDPSGGATGDGALGDGVPGDRPIVTSNIVFVTNSNVNPIWANGLAGADAICQGLADGAGWPGTYVAYLSTSTVNASDRISAARGWTRTDGTPFADTAGQIIAGAMFTNVMYEVTGLRASSGAYWVATGTTSAGTASAMTCNDYTTVSAQLLTGMAAAAGFGFSQDSVYGSCMTSRLYCFGIDRVVPVTPPSVPITGRRAFVSSPWMPGGGLSSADAQCAADATAHGIPGTFQALLATAATSPISRFSTTGPPWLRLDGLPIAPTAADLVTINLREPFNLAADGTYLAGATVWTGTTAVDQAAGSTNATCSDWTTNSMGKLSIVGRPEYADIDWMGGAPTQACNTTARLYCLEP
jgi:hypothetical protein